MKKLSGLLALAVLLTSLTACGQSSGEGGSSTGGTLNVICWTEYLPDDVIASFEAEYGIKVNLTTFSSQDEMLAKVMSSPVGSYDFMIGGNINAFKADELIVPIDKSRLTNAGNIVGDAYYSPSDPTGEYTMPYLGACAVIAVNTDLIDDEISSYQDLLNPAYADQMVVIEDARAVQGMAKMAMGYDINDLSDEAMAAAEEYLMALKPNVHAYNGDSPKTLMLNGECSIGLIYGAECALAMAENPAIIGIFPEEGVYFGFDQMMIGAEGANMDNAYLFMDYLLDGEVSARISEVFPYVNPNSAALEYLDEEFVNNPIKNIPDDVLERSYAVKEMDSDANSRIAEIWNKMKN